MWGKASRTLKSLLTAHHIVLNVLYFLSVGCVADTVRVFGFKARIIVQSFGKFIYILQIGCVVDKYKCQKILHKTRFCSNHQCLSQRCNDISDNHIDVVFSFQCRNLNKLERFSNKLYVSMNLNSHTPAYVQILFIPREKNVPMYITKILELVHYISSAVLKSSSKSSNFSHLFRNPGSAPRYSNIKI